MRGYLSQSGVSLLAGVVLALSLATLIAGPEVPRREADSSAIATIGPFRAAVERFEVRELSDGICVASVQVHLWRPNGPVPLEQRVRIDGTASLGSGWTLRSSDWLVRNEFGRFPAGDSYFDPWLGAVPATHHAGETRAVFTFSFNPNTPGASCPAGVQDLVVQLPGGETAVFSGLRAAVR